MPTTVTISIGSRTSDSVTVSTVTATTVTGFSNAWSVVLSASVPSTTKIGDKLTTGANSYLITGISGSTLTVVGDASAAFTSTTDPATGAATTSRSFATINTWTSGSPANLVTKDWIWKGELYQEGGGTNGEWTFSLDNSTSATCDSTRYFLLTAAPGQSFRDSANKLTNALRYNTANGVAINSNGSYARLFSLSGSALATISNIQINRTTTNGFLFIGSVTVKSCIIKAMSVINHVSGNIYNSVIYTSSIVAGVTPTGWSGQLINNTFYYTGPSVTAVNFGNYSGTTSIIRNNTFFGFAAICNRFDRMNTAASTNNITNLASFGWTATGNLVSKTAANQFSSLLPGLEDFRIKVNADVINAGVRNQTYTNDLDIVGTTRSLTTPTIGAWEYPPITYARPASDITTQWTASTPGAAHYTMINETTYNDTNYIYSTAASQVDEVKLQTMSAPATGTDITINYRIQGITSGAAVTVYLYSGTTLIKTDVTRNSDSATFYTMTVTPSEWVFVTDWTNMRLRFVSS